ncbi:MAG: tyrosine-type recombinase/integrase [Terriglobales bacterium]|jgi:integrase
MRQAGKSTTGSVVKDKRSKKWQFFWWADGKRRSKTLGCFPTKKAAWDAAQAFRVQLPQPKPNAATFPTVAALVEQYRAERMPTRYSTRRGYESWLRCHVIPRWGTHAITDVQPRDVELWLASLALAPKSKAEIRASLGRLWDYAMWCGAVPVGRNPMSLVTVRGASKRLKQPRSLTAEEFQRFVAQLREPFRTIAVLCVALGLRISECLALKWSDVDWLGGALLVQRGIVIGRVDETKTEGSRRALTLAPEIVAILKAWKTSTQFGGADDWIFASPTQLGRLPWSYPWTWKLVQDAAKAAGLETFGTHTLRHSYRSWLDAVGTSLAVQQKLMRHADIRTTMNIYGDVVTDEMATASAKVARLVVNGTGSGTEPTSSH